MLHQLLLLVAALPPQDLTSLRQDRSGEGIVRDRWQVPVPVVRADEDAAALPPVSTFLPTDQLPEGDMPREVVMVDGSTALVVHRDTDNLACFDLDTRTATGVVAVGDFPVDVAVTPDGQTAVVPNVFSDTVSVIDVGTMTNLADIPITGTQPYAVEVTSDGLFAVVGVINDAVSSSFSVIDLQLLQESSTFASTSQGVVGFFFTPESGISGNFFTKFALSPDGVTVVLPDAANDVVTIYDRTTGMARATLPTADFPAGVDISADGQVSVVSHDGSSRTVTVIDLTSDTVSASHNVGVDLRDRRIRITPDKTHAICAILNAVVFVNLGSGLVTSTISTGSPGDIEITFDGQYAFVSNFNSRLIDIATQTVVRTLPLAASYEAALSPSSLRGVALNNRFREDVHVYDLQGASGFVEGREVSGPPLEGDASRTVDVSADGLVAVVAHNTSRSAAVIDMASQTVRAWIPTGDRSLGVAVAPDGNTAVVANACSDTVSILDLTTDTLAVNLPMGQRPAEVLISPDSTTAYVTTVAGTDRIRRVNLAGAGSSITGAMPTGQMGSALGYAFTAVSGIGLSGNGAVLGVCVSFDDELLLIDTATFTQIDRVPVGDFPMFVDFNHAGTLAYVSNAFGDSVSVVRVQGAASTTIATVPGIDFPGTVRVDSPGGYAYVASSGSNPSVTVIDTSTQAAVATVPLPGAVRDSHLSRADSTLYLSATASGGIGQLLRVDARGPGSSLIQTIPLTSTPCEVGFSETLGTAILAEPIPDGVDLITFSPAGKLRRGRL